MTLTVETGAGVAGADTFVSLAQYEAYADALGWSISETDATNEANLRRAAQYLSRTPSWVGYRTNDGQTLSWPRVISVVVDGWPVESDEIPQRIKDAQCELAYLIQGGLDPFETIGGAGGGDTIKVGPITISDGTASGGADKIKAVSGLLRPFLMAGAGQAAMVRG